MPHWISLIICYTFIIVAFTLMMFLRRKSCTTTAPEDSPSKTEPSPTGQTLTISRQARQLLASEVAVHGTIPVRVLQEDTEFRSAPVFPMDRERARLDARSRSASRSELSTDGGHNDNV